MAGLRTFAQWLATKQRFAVRPLLAARSTRAIGLVSVAPAVQQRQQQQQLWPDNPTRRAKSTDPSAGTRHAFEEEEHLGRGLSRYRIDEKQIERWKKNLGKVPQLKLTVPDDFLNPLPEYERKALKEIHNRSFASNILLEVRDVRLPASSHHPSITRLAAHRIHLICFTHADMIDSATRDRVEAWATRSFPGARCFFLDTRENRTGFSGKAKQATDAPEADAPTEAAETVPSGPFDLLYDSLIELLENRGSINTALTVGVANTGKSSLLMALLKTARRRGDLKKTILIAKSGQWGKKGKVPKRSLVKSRQPVAIEDRPGKTREITEYLLCEKPRAYFLDVPGLTPPYYFFQERPEAWFAFGAANLIHLGKHADKNLELQSVFCRFVLYAMNRDGNFAYVAKLGLTKPTHDLITVLDGIIPPKDQDGPVSEHFRLRQCKNFLKFFNTGNFGPVILDDLSKPYQKFVFKDKHFRSKPWKDRYRQGPRNVDEFGDWKDLDSGGSDRPRDGGGAGAGHAEGEEEDDEDGFYRN